MWPWKFAALAVLAACAAVLAGLALGTPASRGESGPLQYWPTLDPDPVRPAAVFIGDSYSAGVGASEPGKRWTSIVAADQGWEEINLALGGTGYLTVAGPSGCGEPYCPNYQATIAEAIRRGPSIVVVAGGQNDQGADADEVSAAVEATYRWLRDGLPDAEIIAVGPSSPSTSDGIVAIDAAVRKAAKANGAQFVSLLDPAVLTDDMLLDDGAHVGDSGHAAIASRVEEKLQEERSDP